MSDLASEAGLMVCKVGGTISTIEKNALINRNEVLKIRSSVAGQPVTRPRSTMTCSGLSKAHNQFCEIPLH
jgi:hypothetical protein